jgi:release factor glutamine methyltransferase
MTYKEALVAGTGFISRREAVLLLSHVTGASVTEISINPERALYPSVKEAYLELIRKRVEHVPLQYLLGVWQFMGFDFIVNPAVLIPRQDTEVLVERAVNLKPRRVLDLCTGSGCIGISIAKLTDAEVTATDISGDALTVARQNAELNGVVERVHFIESDLFNKVPKEKFDLIISNPPYIPTGEIPGLQVEVRSYEPLSALDGGLDGLDFYRKIIPEAVDFLSPTGTLITEVGPAEGVRELFRQYGYMDITTINDLAGLERGVMGKLIMEEINV